MLKRLCVKPSTSQTLLIEREELPIIPVPIIFPFWCPPKPTEPPSFMLRVWNINLSPGICREQPLSRYHACCFVLPCRHTCNRNNFIFRYPYLYGSLLVSSGWFLLSQTIVIEATQLSLVQKLWNIVLRFLLE